MINRVLDQVALVEKAEMVVQMSRHHTFNESVQEAAAAAEAGPGQRQVAVAGSC